MNIKKRIAKVFRSILTIISPILNTKVIYRVKFGKNLNLCNPVTLNEKISWLKLNTYYNNDLVKTCADKYKVRSYIERADCAEILNGLVGVYYSPNDIPWEKLPSKFALKYNIGAGCNMIVPDKTKLDTAEAERIVSKWFKTKPYLGYSEMQYKGIKPCVICEEYLGDNEGHFPLDYKFYCFNGKAKYVMICIGREKGKPEYHFYDREWNFVPFQSLIDPHITKPDKIEKAFEYADKLSKPFPFVRTDLYIVNHKIYFGELTFSSMGGFDTDITVDADRIMGSLISECSLTSMTFFN